MIATLAALALLGAPLQTPVPVHRVPVDPRVRVPRFAADGQRLFLGDQTYVPPGLPPGGDALWLQSYLGIGRVLVYEQGPHGWFHHSTIEPPIQGVYGVFGAQVACSGDELLVSSQPGGLTSPEIALHFFRYVDGGWVEVDRTSVARGFIAWEGNLLASMEFGPGSRRTTNVYRKHGAAWTHVETLETVDPNLAYGGFDVSDSTLAIGYRGRATVDLYRIHDGQLVLEQTLDTPTFPVGLEFGAAVLFDGERLVVGAPDIYGGPSHAPNGRVFVYERDEAGWTLTGDLEQPGAPAVNLWNIGWIIGAEDDTILSFTMVPTWAAQEYRLVDGAWTKQRLIPLPSGTTTNFLAGNRFAGDQLFLAAFELSGWPYGRLRALQFDLEQD